MVVRRAILVQFNRVISINSTTVLRIAGLHGENNSLTSNLYSWKNFRECRSFRCMQTIMRRGYLEEFVELK